MVPNKYKKVQQDKIKIKRDKKHKSHFLLTIATSHDNQGCTCNIANKTLDKDLGNGSIVVWSSLNPYFLERSCFGLCHYDRDEFQFLFLGIIHA